MVNIVFKKKKPDKIVGLHNYFTNLFL